MRTLFLVITVLVSTVVSAQTQSENYVKTTVYQTEVQDGQQSQVLESDKIESVNYFDGLGRVKQSIAVRAGGQKQSTNIFDWTDDWTVGNGSTPLFNSTGRTVDNKREFGTNPFSEQSLLWRCGNNENIQTNAGWNSDHFTIDKSIGYMYTVWIKRTGTVSGTAYHGIWDVNFVNGTSNGNPYFLHEKLPNASTWYLLVGMIYPHNYTGGNPSISGIYDVNGTKVVNGTDFKWKNTTTSTRLRDFYYDGNATNSYAYYWNPKISRVDNNLQPIAQLIEQSKPKDIITHYEYDALSRQSKQYLPYASEGTQNGAIYTDPLTELNNFYNTTKYQNTTNPYSETIFEASPLSRPLKQAAPGLEWIAKSTGDDHTIKLDRKANSAADDVVYFKVNFTGGNTEAPALVKVGDYPDNELFVNITKDENWKSSDGDNHTTREYTDKSGRVVLKRTYNGSAHDTYYVYDDFGNLTYVIPPKVTVTNGVSTTELNELGYQYKYDSRNRLVEKKIPGKGWEYIVYNKLDQPVMTQDANQRPKREWLFTKYDVFGRVAFTGLHIHPSVINRTIMQGFADTRSTNWVNRTTSSIVIAGTSIYYSNDAIPTGINQIYTINYYDNYTFDQDGMNKPASVYGVSTSNNVKSLPTGSKIRVLGTNNWITTVIGYDDSGRTIWSGTRNHYLSTIDKTETKLDFVGKPIEARTSHVKNGSTPLITTDTFTYDHMGRLVTQKQQINNFAEELIAHNVYDDLGQLESKKVGNAEQAPLQTVDYKYNVRGWLTDINDVNTIGDDLFTFKINYNTVEGSYNVPSLYNGNIAQTIWKTTNDNTKRSYAHEYDALNRIKGSYLRFNESLTEAFRRSYDLRDIEYDKNGNITTLIRYDQAGTDNVMDNLTYEYDNGNKLNKVTDSGNKNEGFIEGSNTDNDYLYDDNGNMIFDKNKDISSITYNHLNLPERIEFVSSIPSQQKRIDYVYDATGLKLRKVVTNYPSSNTTEYAGNHIYESNYSIGLPPGPNNSDEKVLKFMNHPEGYIEPNGTGEFDYVYQYKDHLGNIRLSYSDKDRDGKIDILRNNADVDGDGDLAHEILQEKNYYPFGLQHKGYNDLIISEHKYGFGGKEEQNELGLKWIDITARNYDPAIGRWMNLDPLAEDMRRHSPYNYAFNNPIYFIDPDGMAPTDHYLDENGKYLGEDGAVTNNVRVIYGDDFRDIKSNNNGSTLSMEATSQLQKSSNVVTINENKIQNDIDNVNNQTVVDQSVERQTSIVLKIDSKSAGNPTAEVTSVRGADGVTSVNSGNATISYDVQRDGRKTVGGSQNILLGVVHSHNDVSSTTTTGTTTTTRTNIPGTSPTDVNTSSKLGIPIYSIDSFTGKISSSVPAPFSGGTGPLMHRTYNGKQTNNISRTFNQSVGQDALKKYL